MRKVQRPAASKSIQQYLTKKEAAVVAARLSGQLDIEGIWKGARQTKVIGETALGLLQGAMGPRQRCMYCLDAHGTDIDHFWPKARYPRHAFRWDNWLLCCTECGRIKGSQFPLARNGRPLLVNPCAEDSWLHLDFDVDTGNLMARFDPKLQSPSIKGVKTVEALDLDKREALATGYRLTFKRLAAVIERALNAPQFPGGQFLADLQEADDHGLLPWCFHWAGRNEPAFVKLRQSQPGTWETCAAAV